MVFSATTEFPRRINRHCHTIPLSRRMQGEVARIGTLETRPGAKVKGYFPFSRNSLKRLPSCYIRQWIQSKGMDPTIRNCRGVATTFPPMKCRGSLKRVCMMERPHQPASRPSDIFLSTSRKSRQMVPMGVDRRQARGRCL